MAETDALAYEGRQRPFFFAIQGLGFDRRRMYMGDRETRRLGIRKLVRQYTKAAASQAYTGIGCNSLILCLHVSMSPKTLELQ